jgi:cell division cycle 14
LCTRRCAQATTDPPGSNRYWNFFLDFGPLNLGQTYRFCEALHAKLADPKLQSGHVVYWSGTQGSRRANSVLLICTYSMLYLGRSAEEAWRPFAQMGARLPPFHDATPGVCTYKLTVLDCLRGMDKARALGFLDFRTFDVDEYDHFEKVESGDLSWIFPRRFVAFAGPHETKSMDDMYPTCVPEDYLEHFRARNVKLVVRLNKKYYDERRFIQAGIEHEDIFYPDGSCPAPQILNRFLEVCESRPASEAIAVHCKAGLGRTGTCIGAYAMKHWGFTAAEVIGWMRVARPGSVIGPQQQFMESIQDAMHQAGAAKAFGSPKRAVLTHRGEAASPEEGPTQGDYLMSARVNSPGAPNARRSMASPDADLSSFSLRSVARKLYAVGGR